MNIEIEGTIETKKDFTTRQSDQTILLAAYTSDEEISGNEPENVLDKRPKSDTNSHVCKRRRKKRKKHIWYQKIKIMTTGVM